ncbi:hypothetical protein GCM10010116_55150 [Microbispora rosea subsp. aerata]|nr:hypothetical protein [Microbispora rosea]GGO27515.1 hypothetical protein GCM10010116_55150 [Microbispora rosea subsp. aerata]GIH58586.1 hypothetical protein Mro02_55000 [Microbispora rosea subsp. aerata]GLJ85327.1 hypothetical protein GCM10017588_40560 [Microbispora rosea subsp. aerata]
MARTLPPVQAVRAEYDAWCRRDLTDVELDYLFLDASHFTTHDGSRAEPILAAWGITTAGKPVFVGLAGRGPRPPLLIVSDGAPR